LAPVAGKIGREIKHPNGKSKGPAPTSLQLTYLRRELARFLALEAVHQDEDATQRYALASFLRQYPSPLATKKYRKEQQRIDAATDTDPVSFLSAHLLRREFVETRRGRPEEELADLASDNHYLDRYYLLTKLQYACRKASYTVLNKNNQELPLLSPALDAVLHEPRWAADPILQLYAQAYLVISGSPAADTEKLHQMFFEREAFLHVPAMRDLFVGLLNNTIKRMNLGEPGYDRLAFELFRIGINSKLLYVNGKLSGQTYMNVVFNALKVKEMDWLESFLDTSREDLHPKDQESSYLFALGSYHYEKGNLAAARDRLMEFNYSATSLIMQLQARVTLAKVYFDLAETDLLDSHLNSLTVFLSRHQELGYTREIILRFVKACRQLLYLAPGVRAEKIDKLQREIEAIPVRSYRDWLLARLPK
ncbi:MAG: hypothetical protein AAFZ52_03645, partial [Bacteroidota bacterium]